MTLLTKFEFIGKQDEHTVSGYNFISSEQELIDYLKENKVTDYFYAPAGLLPEELVLTIDVITAIFDFFDEEGGRIQNSKSIAVFKRFNNAVLAGDI